MDNLWTETTFDQFIKLNRGFDLPNRLISPGIFPVVASTSIKAYHKESKVSGPGVVTGRSGSLGTVQYVLGEFWPLNTTLYVKDFKGNDPRFVYYFLQTMRLENFNAGAGVPTLNQNHLHKLTIRIPVVALQEKIADLLGNYDDLISNCEKQLAKLSELSEQLYREWFVRMRFPGHASTEFERGIPKSWIPMKLGDLADSQYGYTASATDEPVGPKFLRITDIVPDSIDWDEVPHCPIDANEKPKYELHEGDTVVARTGATVGYAKRIHKRHPSSVFASFLVRFTPKRIKDGMFLGFSIERQYFKDFIQMFVTGAAQPQANANTMSMFPIYYPGETLVDDFSRILEPILDQKELLCERIAKLERSRDLLLPRLISGELSIYTAIHKESEELVHA